MRTIGGFQFPDPDDPDSVRVADAKAWQPEFRCVALHRQFVLLAKTRIEGAWNAYGVPVSGEIEHLFEALDKWEDDGAKIPEEIARAAFPRFADLRYSH